MSRALIFLLLCLPLRGHYDVSAAVAALTEEIKSAPTAELYYRRAIEFRALREKDHAVSDLRAALKLEAHPASLAVLAELLSARGEHPEALQLSARFLKLQPGPGSSYLAAELALAAGDPEQALVHIQKGPPAKDATHLLHAYLLEEKGEHQKAATILKAAHQSTKSIVLKNSWIDAAINAGQFDEVLPIVNEEIKTSRFKASHRIRRACIIRGIGRQDYQEVAQAELELALEEVNARIHPDRPDLTLIHDRAFVLALLGKKEEARRDLALLKKAAYPPISLGQLNRLLR